MNKIANFAAWSALFIAGLSAMRCETKTVRYVASVRDTFRLSVLEERSFIVEYTIASPAANHNIELENGRTIESLHVESVLIKATPLKENETQFLLMEGEVKAGDVIVPLIEETVLVLTGHPEYVRVNSHSAGIAALENELLRYLNANPGDGLSVLANGAAVNQNSAATNERIEAELSLVLHASATISEEWEIPGW